MAENFELSAEIHPELVEGFAPKTQALVDRALARVKDPTVKIKADLEQGFAEQARKAIDRALARSNAVVRVKSAVDQSSLDSAIARIQARLDSTRFTANVKTEVDNPSLAAALAGIRARVGAFNPTVKVDVDGNSVERAVRGVATKAATALGSALANIMGEIITTLPGKLGDGLAKMVSASGPVGLAIAASIAAIITPAIVAAAALITAAVGGAVAAGITAAGVGAGLVLAFKNPAVKAAAADLGHTLEATLTEAADSFLGPTLAAIATIKAEIASELAPAFKGVFDKLAPMVGPLVDNAVKAAKMIVGIADNIAAKGAPLLEFFSGPVLMMSIAAVDHLIDTILNNITGVKAGMMVVLLAVGMAVAVLEAMLVVANLIGKAFVWMGQQILDVARPFAWIMDHTFGSGNVDELDRISANVDKVGGSAVSAAPPVDALTAAIGANDAAIKSAAPAIEARTAALTALSAIGSTFSKAFELQNQASNFAVSSNTGKLQGEQAIGDQVAGFAQAQVSAARSVSDANVAMGEAAQSAYKATSSAAEGVTEARRNAVESVKSASKAVVDAQRGELDAQRALTQARKDAVRQLEDMAAQSAGLADGEEAARLRLARAEAAVGIVKPGQDSAALDARDRQLTLHDAQRGLQETLRGNDRTRRDNAAALKAGVDGAAGVVAAQKGVDDAHAATVAAQVGLQKANVEGAKSIAQAQQALSEAQASGAKSLDSAARTVSDASVALGKVMAKGGAGDLGNTITGLANTAAVQKAIKTSVTDPHAAWLTWLADQGVTVSPETANVHLEALRTSMLNSPAMKGFDPVQLKKLVDVLTVNTPMIAIEVNSAQLDYADKATLDLNRNLTNLKSNFGMSDSAMRGRTRDEQAIAPPMIDETRDAHLWETAFNPNYVQGSGWIGKGAQMRTGKKIADPNWVRPTSPAGTGGGINIAASIDTAALAPKMDEARKIIGDKWAEIWRELPTSPPAVAAQKATLDGVYDAIRKMWGDVQVLSLGAYADLWVQLLANQVAKSQLAPLTTSVTSAFAGMWTSIAAGSAVGMNSVISTINAGLVNINAALTATGVTFQIPAIKSVVAPSVITNAGGGAQGLGSPLGGGHAVGGYIRGPGTTTSDEIYAGNNHWLSDKEFVVNARSTARLGVDNLSYMNATGRMPGHTGYAAGGLHSEGLSPGMGRNLGAGPYLMQLMKKLGGSGKFGNDYRPGDPLWHGSGLALDYIGYNQDALAAQLMQRGGQLLELIHSTGKANYGITRGRVSDMGSEWAKHKDHIHVAASLGALADMLGGAIDPAIAAGGSGAGGSAAALPVFDAAAAMAKIIPEFDKARASMSSTGIGAFGVGAFNKLQDGVKAKADQQALAGAAFSAGGNGTMGAGSGNIMRDALSTALGLGASAKVILALFEAGNVESNWKNSPIATDHDSVGFLQQRPSTGWGTIAQIMNVPYATGSFVRRAMAKRGAGTAGQLAQSVQVSAFPDRYDQRRGDAIGQLAGLGYRGPFDGFAGGGLVGAGLYDNGGQLMPNGIAVNRTGRPEMVLPNNAAGTPMVSLSRADMRTLASLMAQAVSTRPAQLTADGKVIAETVIPHMEAALTIPGSGL